MSKETFWVFGIDYLEQCVTLRNDAIELFISKTNIKNEKNALKMLNVIRSKGLIEAGTFFVILNSKYLQFIVFHLNSNRKGTMPSSSTKKF